jgi:signal transduction histidine kinase/DNA-binding NarL/FixJ family response regulator
VTVIITYNVLLGSYVKSSIQAEGELSALESAKNVEIYLSTGTDIIEMADYSVYSLLEEDASDEEILDCLTRDTITVQNSVLPASTGIYGCIRGKYFDGSGWDPGEDYVPQERPWYTEAIAAPGNTVFINPYFDLFSNQVVMTIARVLPDGENVVAIDVTLGRIQEITEATTKSERDTIRMIIARNGFVVAHSDKHERARNYLEEKDSLGGYVLQSVLESGEDYVDISYKGNNYTVYAVPIGSDWISISVVDAENINAPRMKMLFASIGAVIITLITFAVIMIRTGKRAIANDSLQSILASSADIYMSLCDLDVINNTVTGIKNVNPAIAKAVEDCDGNMKEVFLGIMKGLPDSPTKQAAIDFTDLSTIDERMKDTNIATVEYLSYGNIWVRARFVVSQRTEDGKVSHVLWMLENIDKEKKERDKLIDMSERALAANEAKSTFLSNMSHEIRTPINTVLGMDEMILRESSEPAIRGYASDIYTAGNTLLSLINDILDSSKIESGKMEIVPVDYELATLIRDLINMISQRARDKDLIFKVEVDENLPSKLHGDDVRIRQVVTNILTNVVKYTHDGFVTRRVMLTDITVSSEASSSEDKKLGSRKTGKSSAGSDETSDSVQIRFEVEDTGIGIKEEDLPKLFEEFQRIEEGRNRNIEGTGLGMNITMQLLKLMDSSLKVKSEYGKGSVFWFDLNQQVVDSEPIGDFNEKLSAPDESYNHKGAFIAPDAHVLVVDDNDMNRKVFKSLLKVTQINISDASSGVKALQFAENVRYDMVFMDHMMPDMDGVETMKRMRQIKGYENVPIYVLTANAVTGAREQYLEAGFDGFVSKPVVSDKLEQALREGLPDRLVISIEDSDEVMGDPNEVMEEARSESVDDLPMIDGVDWNFAWLHLPDMELLESSVKDFYDGIRIQADKLDRMYDEVLKESGETNVDAEIAAGGPVEDGTLDAMKEVGTGNMEDEAMSAYRIQVHAMKSSAATIGIVPLAGMAKILEFAARDLDADTIRQMHDVFIREWRSYTDKLGGVFGLEESTSGDGDKDYADDEMLGAMLEMLYNALEDFDVDACDDIMKQIRSYSYDDDTQILVDVLAGAVTDLDTDMAEDTIDKIRDNLGR